MPANFELNGIFFFKTGSNVVYKSAFLILMQIKFGGPRGNRTPDSSMPWTRVTTILQALLWVGTGLS